MAAYRGLSSDEQAQDISLGSAMASKRRLESNCVDNWNTPKRLKDQVERRSGPKESTIPNSTIPNSPTTPLPSTEIRGCGRPIRDLCSLFRHGWPQTLLSVRLDRSGMLDDDYFQLLPQVATRDFLVRRNNETQSQLYLHYHTRIEPATGPRIKLRFHAGAMS